MSLKQIYFVSILVLISSAVAFGQVNGQLNGSVVDPSGASVPDATVNLYLTGGTNAVLSTKTTSDGLFNFAAVRPETYKLEVEAPGFAKYSQTGIVIDPVHLTSLRVIQLEVQSTGQSVIVSESAVTLDTSTAEVSSTVTQKQVENLPVLDRQVNNLFYTQPGVNANGNAESAVNGLRAANTNVTLDGVNIQDNFIRINGIDYLPNKLTIGEVSEITISSSNSSPDVSGNGNAITISTPSGTNSIHGNAYWYNRNNFFSANDWFNNKDGVARPFLNLNQFGGSVGGPIKKDKLFYLATYETYDLHQTSPTTRTILTPTAQQGILQYPDASGNIRQFNVLTPQQLPLDSYMKTEVAALPKNGNSNAVGDGLNTTGYQFNARSNERRDSILGKIDYNLSTKHILTGTYRWNRDNLDRPDMGNFYTVVPPVSNRLSAHIFAAGWRWTPSPTFTNELRGGGDVGTFPFNVSGKSPAFFITGAAYDTPVNQFLPQGRDTHTYNIQDTATWTHGKHTVTFGFQTQQVRVKSSDHGGIVPSYALGYAPTSTLGYNVGDIPGASAFYVNEANSLQQTLGGILLSGTQSYNITSRTSGFVPGAPLVQNISFNNYAGFVKDTWKAMPRLSLTLGLRWDYFPPVTERDSLLLQPELINNNPVQTLLANATLNFSGDSVGRPMYHSDWNNFAPSVGIAWDLFGNGKTVFRAGGGFFYAQDDILEGALTTASANFGLVGSSGLQGLVGAYAAAPPSIKTPQFQVPITTEQNFINTAGSNIQGLIDPNLRTPYVPQWNASIEHEFKNMIVSATYVGNHAVKLHRQIDYNQINIYGGGFLKDFRNARSNGLLAQKASGSFDPSYNPDIPGSVPLPFFDSLPGGGFLGVSSVARNILQGQVGTLAQVYQQNGIFPSDTFSFFPNPFSLYSSLDGNLANSSYDAIQFEVKRRTASGIQFQASYVFGKVLSNVSASRGLDALLDNNNPSIERARAPWDLTQAFKLSHHIPIPMGNGHRVNYQPLNRILEGWALSGFLTVQSGAPISILSGRGTLNRGARSAQNTVNTNLSLGELQKISGIFMTGSGPYFINPANIDPTTGEGVAPDGATPFNGQVFFNPDAGTVGSLQRRVLSAPWFNNYDFSISKDTRITERQQIQFKAEFFNLFNHPTFAVGNNSAYGLNVNDPGFGKITQQFYSAQGVGPRVIQFALYYKF